MFGFANQLQLQIDWTVRNQMRAYKRVANGAKGAAFDPMRLFYMTKVRPRIAYACPVWFLPEDAKAQFKLRPGIRQKLVDLEVHCMIQITGGMSTTAHALLRSETTIEPITEHLRRRVYLFQCKALDTAWYQKLSEWRCTPTEAGSQQWKESAPERHLNLLRDKHPYHVLDRIAQTLMNDSERNRTSPKELLDDRIIKHCKGLLETYPSEKNNIQFKEKPAAWAGWSENTPKLYRDLPRELSTLLFHIRTGTISLRKYIKRIRVSQSVLAYSLQIC